MVEASPLCKDVDLVISSKFLVSLCCEILCESLLSRALLVLVFLALWRISWRFDFL